MNIKIKNVQEAEGFKTLVGLMKPLIFGGRLGFIHLGIRACLEVLPHAHTYKGTLYCRGGELDVIPEYEAVTLAEKVENHGDDAT